MSNEAEEQKVTEDERTCTERSTRPKDYVAHEDVDVGLRDLAHEIYERACDDGSVGGHYENVRLAWRVPPPHEGSQWTKRTGWIVYRCDVTSKRFAVPKDAPVPVLAMEEPKPDACGAWLRVRIVHPDLLYDRAELVEEIVSGLTAEIIEDLFGVTRAFNLLHALSEMEALPDTGVSDPYRTVKGERHGYEGLGYGPM